mmetsp:Transcript_7534/g.9584  ORF Transcript_7534/g.9584 Transcript_7534/m.9584 type:complete len:163 (-) Transcript_7534:1122-1610(-)|eukprot:CAMPEP_0204828456 /NCGR_PEP_ID=MMETSP1346-20131115/6227_1 /ASSEMBLY_ACC=CAM_ASM_000771 /TAXON_ID=215587 /ORGANISM="Aplanochytrium stocchinoi, Strain GSBS06" /LENGTH=162 /DNA_ID=CAMNT_0051957539 /DNA_START=169 /DNA_END=657 /DNA_ORIENTATION=+
MAVEFTGPAAYFFGYMGATIALVFAILGAAYGTAKCGVGIMSMGVLHPDMVIKNIMPVVMAGVLGIYGLVVAVILKGTLSDETGEPCTDPNACFTYANGFKHLAAGLSVGISALGAGMAVGIIGDVGIRAAGQQEKLYVGMILILIFAGAPGMYGLIAALAF